jgi:hypothetical protein
VVETDFTNSATAFVPAPIQALKDLAGTRVRSKSLVDLESGSPRKPCFMAQPRRDRRGWITLGALAFAAAAGAVYYFSQVGSIWPVQEPERKKKTVVLVLGQVRPEVHVNTSISSTKSLRMKSRNLMRIHLSSVRLHFVVNSMTMS